MSGVPASLTRFNGAAASGLAPTNRLDQHEELSNETVSFSAAFL
jgi:hypothetical protein